MGTSSIYEGPIDKNKLIPPDYDGTDNDKQDNNNQQNQSNNIWNKIISSIKGWFRR